MGGATSTALVSGGAANAGGAGGAPATGGNAAGGVATGGFATGGTASGGASIVATQGKIQWLTLANERAYPNDEPNSTFEIDGRLYATQDSCASVTFDPISRCATGILCDYAGSNWGMAVQFDFRITASPSGGKLTWNPATHGTIGVAWEISGTPTNALELWVLCMDPQFDSSCTAATCEASGPPWGASTIALDGTFYFADATPDDWGGTSPSPYIPGQVFALQFKLPAVKVGATSFRYCVQRLGLIVSQ